VMQEKVIETVKDFVMEAFLPGEDPNELQADTPLITGGILDSIATIKLVAFIEERFGIEVQAHETDVEHLNTLNDVAQLVQSKL
jgi:acyl carrier protein